MPSTSATHRHQHVVRALADLGRAAERGDAAAAIELQLHAGVRQVVPVDRQARAGEIRRARQADAAAERQLAELVAPVRIARRRCWMHSARPMVPTRR